MTLSAQERSDRFKIHDLLVRCCYAIIDYSDMLAVKGSPTR